MSKPRRRHTAEQKAELLRQHVVEKKPVSEVCNEAEIQPSLFYTWQRELLAGAHTVFSTRRAPSRENELEAKVSRLEARVARKDQIIAEVTSSLEEARRLMERFVAYYNGVRLHSAIGYIAPLDFMAGKAPEIWSERDRKLEQARESRRERRSNKVPA